MKNYWYVSNLVEKKKLNLLLQELKFITNFFLEKRKKHKYFKKKSIDEKLIFLNQNYKSDLKEIYNYIQAFISYNPIIDPKLIAKKINYLSNIKLYPFVPAVRIDFPENNDANLNWHQEINKLKNSNFFQVWVPIKENSSEKNGGLIIKEFHKNKIFKHKNYKEKNINKAVIIENKEFKKLKTINTKIKKGDGIVFKKYLPHKSGINKSNKVRLSLVQSFHDIKTMKKIGKLKYSEI